MNCIEGKAIEGIEKYPLFFQEFYAQYEKSKGWEVLFMEEDKAVIPIKRRSALFVKQAQYLYPPLKNGKPLSPQEEKIFLEKMIAFCRKKRICDFISPPLHYSIFQTAPQESYYTDLGIIVVDLQKSENEIFKRFSNNYRNEIRKALTEGITIKFDNHLFDTFYSLYKSTHEKQGIYFDSEDELRNLTNYLGEKNCRIAVAQKGKEMYGASLILFHADEAYYYQSGASENNIYPGANKLLQFEIMKWLKQEGVKRYCLGGYRQGDISGTKYAGIQKFKIRFGAEVEMGYHFYTKVSWRYDVYKTLLKYYLILRGAEPSTVGLNFRKN